MVCLVLARQIHSRRAWECSSLYSICPQIQNHHLRYQPPYTWDRRSHYVTCWKIPPARLLQRRRTPFRTRAMLRENVRSSLRQSLTTRYGSPSIQVDTAHGVEVARVDHAVRAFALDVYPIILTLAPS